jgi:hypothetical protein
MMGTTPSATTAAKIPCATALIIDVIVASSADGSLYLRFGGLGGTDRDPVFVSGGGVGEFDCTDQEGERRRRRRE